MSDAVYKKEHFNLYYIFKEDKEEKSLSERIIEEYYKKVKAMLENKFT